MLRMQSAVKSLGCRLPAVIGTLLWGAGSARAQTVPPADPATPPAAATPAAAAPTPAPPPAITFSALLDGYYSYNFNNPRAAAGSSAPGVNGPGYENDVSLISGRRFDYKDNTFTLGLAELGVTRAVDDVSRLGFTAKVTYGPTATAVEYGGNTGHSTEQDSLNLLQAYATFLIPVKGGKDLTVDAGKFVTHMGYEALEPELDWNYSRSDLFQFFIPLYHGGIRASLPFGPKFTASVYLYNGWNDAATDTNSAKSPGFQFAFTPSSRFSFLINGLFSEEPQGGEDLPKDTIEPTITYQLTRSLSAVIDANFDTGTYYDGDDGDKVRYKAQGVATYLHYALNKGSALTLRAEYFSDPESALTETTVQDAGEFTATYGFMSPLFPGAETRLEYRYDAANHDGFFADSSGNFSRTNQSTLSISENLHF